MKRLLTVFVLCLAAVAAANDLRIVSARYGARETWVDVTEKVRALVQGGALTVKSETGLAGHDPIFGVQKELRVVYTIGGQQYLVLIREGDTATLPSAAAIAVSGSPPPASAPVAPSTPPTPATPVPASPVRPISPTAPAIWAGETVSPKYLWGLVVTVKPSGVVVGCRPYDGGLSPLPPGAAAPPEYFRSEVRGTVLLAGYPRRAKIADGDVIECNAVEDGVETVGSATIHRWRWTQAATATQKPALELARLIQGLPAAAAQTFPAAWSKDGADGLMAKRSWLAMWANRIPDPNRAQLQMIFVSQLVKSDSGNGSRLDRQSRAREARGLLGSIKVRCARWPDVATVCAQLETELQPTLAEMEKP